MKCKGKSEQNLWFRQRPRPSDNAYVSVSGVGIDVAVVNEQVLLTNVPSENEVAWTQALAYPR